MIELSSRILWLINSSIADGCSCIVVNGDVVAQGSKFSLKDVELVVTQMDLDAVCLYFSLIITYKSIIFIRDAFFLLCYCPL